MGDPAGGLMERYFSTEQASGLQVASDTDGMPPFDLFMQLNEVWIKGGSLSGLCTWTSPVTLAST